MASSPAAGRPEHLVAAVEAALAERRPPWFDPEQGETVLVPERPGRGYWVGAPCVVAGGGRVLLSYRRRRPRDGSAQERGHMAAIAESSDGGRTFADIWSMSKQEVGTSSIERFCLRLGPEGRDWLLYTSWEDPPSSGRWRVDLMQASTPDGFSLSRAQAVLLPGDVGVDAVKDPYVLSHGGEVLMYLSTFLTPKGPAPTSLATSRDGLRFAWQGQALGVGQGWDAYQARLSSVAAMPGGFLGYYDGAASFADDTEEHCGLAVSSDLRTWWPVTTRAPALVSPYGTGSLRYVEALTIEGAPWVYYEYTRPDGSHELRRNRLS
ncbi:MAG TPA: sialidase family protein [Acidimicrobiales bacterium]|nr:sialidase family protein [Acidimicrobiales bacterium]